MNHFGKWWKTAARVVLTFVVIVVLFQFVDWRHVMSALAGASLAWLLPAYALVVVRRVLEVAQMTRLLRYVRCPVAWWRVFRANALAGFYAIFTPGSLIPAAVKWTDLAAATGRRAMVFHAIVYSRLLLDLQPVIVGAAALAWSNPTGQPLLTIAAAALAALELALAMWLFAPGLGSAARSASKLVAGFLPVSLRARIDRLLDELEPFRALPIARHLSLAAVALLSFAVGIATRFMLMKALGFDVPLSTIIWVDAILVVVGHMPITIGNFGVREGLVVAAFGVYGVPANVAVAYGLLVYSCRLIMALVGGGYQLALIAGWSTMRSATPGQSERSAAHVIADPATLESTKERA